jgi:hypothetical protein
VYLTKDHQRFSGGDRLSLSPRPSQGLGVII